jgi:cytochrome c-type biogenesis protein CcmE
MTPRMRRAALIGGVLLALAAATALVLNAFRSNLVFFFTPAQVATGEAPTQRTFRLGGLVRAGSVVRDGVQVRFVVTDTQRDVTVAFQGSLPDLFKEGKGVVAQGSLGADGVFMAREVLAKHDENYMPPEAAEALKRAQQHSPQSAPTLIEASR